MYLVRGPHLQSELVQVPDKLSSADQVFRFIVGSSPGRDAGEMQYWIASLILLRDQESSGYCAIIWLRAKLHQFGFKELAPPTHIRGQPKLLIAIFRIRQWGKKGLHDFDRRD